VRRQIHGIWTVRAGEVAAIGEGLDNLCRQAELMRDAAPAAVARLGPAGITARLVALYADLLESARVK